MAPLFGQDFQPGVEPEHGELIVEDILEDSTCTSDASAATTLADAQPCDQTQPRGPPYYVGEVVMCDPGKRGEEIMPL